MIIGAVAEPATGDYPVGRNVAEAGRRFGVAQGRPGACQTPDPHRLGSKARNEAKGGRYAVSWNR
jgi:hypothetical protein